MPKLAAFMTISLDGYYADASGEMNWAHREDPYGDFDAYVHENASGGGALLLGRKTYDLMVSFWPTEMAKTMNPMVAKAMNEMPKYVVSKSLSETPWSNSHLLKGDLIQEIKDLKAGDGRHMTILGSGSVVDQLSQEGLIDTFSFVIAPIILGGGRRLFEGMTGAPVLKLEETRGFKNSNVLVSYSI